MEADIWPWEPKKGMLCNYSAKYKYGSPGTASGSEVCFSIILGYEAKHNSTNQICEADKHRTCEPHLGGWPDWKNPNCVRRCIETQFKLQICPDSNWLSKPLARKTLVAHLQAQHTSTLTLCSPKPLNAISR